MTKWLVLIGALLFLLSRAQATVWYVHPDSTLNSIQTGLDSCAGNDTVLVGTGTYYENLIWPNIQGIHLISEFGVDTTIIDGDRTGHVILIDTGVDSTTTVKGFTVRNGLGYTGGGISCIFGSSPTINNNIITENEAYGIFLGGGGGIACDGCSAIITNNTITNNIGMFGGGILCVYSAAPTISDNVITGNEAREGEGGGIYCDESSPAVIRNTIMDNTADLGGGIACEDYSSPSITNNIITMNTYVGIWCSYYSSPTIDSCDILSNDGDGVCCLVSGSPVIHYCNITDNSGYGVKNLDSGIIVDAINNWWGHSSGPGGAGPGTGDEVSEHVDYDPWLGNPVGVREEPIVKPAYKMGLCATIFSGPLLLPKGKKCRVFDITGRVVEPAKITRGVYFMEIDNKIVQKIVKIR